MASWFSTSFIFYVLFFIDKERMILYSYFFFRKILKASGRKKIPFCVCRTHHAILTAPGG